MSIHEPIRSMAILDAHPGHEEDTIQLLRDFYTSIHLKGYSSDLLYRDSKTPSRFIHIRVWKSDASRAEAQQDPDVHRYWVRLAEICTITTIYEELEPIFSTYQGATGE